MARAEDFAAIGAGLDSIRQSILQRKLDEYRAERDAEEKARYETQAARQVKLDADMSAFRTSQQQAQTDAAAAAEAQRKFTRDRLTAQEAAKATGQAQFLGRFGAPTPADPEMNPTPSGEPTGGLDISNPAHIAQAAAETGTMTPAQLADLALNLQKGKAAGLDAEAVKPQPFKVTLDGGQTLVGIFNPKTANFHVHNGDKEMVAKQLKDENGRPVLGRFVIPGPDGKPTTISAQQPQPVSTKELYGELRKLDQWELDNPPDSRVGNQILGQQFLLNQRQRQMLMRTLDGIEGGGEEKAAGAAPAVPTAKEPAPTVPTGKPISREQAALFLRQAGGDKEKARALAREAGFTF